MVIVGKILTVAGVEFEFSRPDLFELNKISVSQEPRMLYNPNIHHRQSIRLKEHDYRKKGAYFVTIRTHNRAHLFGKIKKERIKLPAAGPIIIR
jgi:hypothetical protein